MDDRTDLAHYAMDKKYGRLPGRKEEFQAIEDEHFPQCPTAIAARKMLKSTLCLCDKLAAAEKSAQECQRCHNLADACRCGAKAQLV